MSKKDKRLKRKAMREQMRVISSFMKPVPKVPAFGTSSGRISSEEPAAQILPYDLVVVPEGTQVPDNPGCIVYEMKHLKEPSIIKSGYTSMDNLKKLNVRGILNWVFGRTEKEVTAEAVEADIAATPTLEETLALDSEIAEAETTNVSSSTALVPAADRSVSLVGNGSLEVPRFLRHVRPYYLRLAKGSTDLLTLHREVDPKGGFTAMVELYPAEKKLLFAFSVCSNKDLFNRKVAGKICKNRFDSGDFYEIVNYDSRLSSIENIESAFSNYLTAPNGGDNITTPKFSRISKRISVKEIERAYALLEDFYKNSDERLVPVLDDVEEEAITVPTLGQGAIPSLTAQLGLVEQTQSEQKYLH